MTKLQAINKTVIIRPIAEQRNTEAQKTLGGIYLPDQDKPVTCHIGRGIVVSVDPHISEYKLTEGLTVQYVKAAATKLANSDLYATKLDQICAIELEEETK